MRQRPAWLSAFILIFALPALTPAASRAADTTISVLGLEASDGAPDSVAEAITDALRQRVSSSPGFRMVPGKDMIELKAIFACPDEAATCMADAGKSLGVTKLLFGGVKKASSDSYVVTLKLLDVGRKQVDAWVAEQVTRAQSTGPGLKAPVQKWFATLTGQAALGNVRIFATIPGTAVQLDGSPVGTVGTEPLVLSNVATGKHELIGSKAGMPPTKTEIDIVSGETAEVTLDLGASPGTGSGGQPETSTNASRLTLSTTESNRGSPGMRTAGWAMFAGAGLSLVVAAKFMLDVNAINSDLDPYRRTDCTSPTRICDKDGIEAKKLTTRQKEYVDAKTEEGSKFQTLQYVFLGVGGALAITGGILLYAGYADTGPDEGGVAQKSPQWFAAPVISDSGAGAMGGMRF